MEKNIYNNFKNIYIYKYKMKIYFKKNYYLKHDYIYVSYNRRRKTQ